MTRPLPTVPSILNKIKHRFARSHEENDDTGSHIDSADAINALSFERRRRAVEYIATQEGTISVGELAEYIAAAENDCTINEVTSDERSRVYISLIQQHLPKLERLDLIDYDDDRKEIEPTERCARVWRAHQSFCDDLIS